MEAPFPKGKYQYPATGLDGAVHALDEVDLGDWSDTALSGQIDELSRVLCRVDAQVARLADAVRSRGFAIQEVELPLAS